MVAGMPIAPERRAEYPADWAAISLRVRQRAGWVCEFCRQARQGEPHPVTGSRVVLTVAHLDHDHRHGRDEDLAAMCQRCHLTYDAPQHRASLARTRRRRLAQLDMLDQAEA